MREQGTRIHSQARALEDLTDLCASISILIEPGEMPRVEELLRLLLEQIAVAQAQVGTTGNSSSHIV